MELYNDGVSWVELHRRVQKRKNNATKGWSYQRMKSKFKTSFLVLYCHRFFNKSLFVYWTMAQFSIGISVKLDKITQHYQKASVSAILRVLWLLIDIIQVWDSFGTHRCHYKNIQRTSSMSGKDLATCTCYTCSLLEC